MQSKFALYEKKETRKILLVDDEGQIFEIVGYNLTQGDIRFTATNGRKLAQNEKRNSRLIIMDVIMTRNGRHGGMRKY
jgi:two-component system alkaline phosphatase synthesis response regulator PhoP